MGTESSTKDLSRRQFIDKSIKGTTIAAYVAPVIMTVALNKAAEAVTGGAGGKGKGHGIPSECRGLTGRALGDCLGHGKGKGKGKG